VLCVDGGGDDTMVGDRVDELARAVCEGRDRAALEQACESIDRAVVAATTETDSGETHTQRCCAFR
jgi:hypothetical protein